jgi:DNA-binding NarL/FixJ family response regulator
MNKIRIIIVDDDALASASIKTILEADDDITVCSVGQNGTEAVRLYAEHQPDVALLDIQMPGMNGLDAAVEIISHDLNAKILFLTTFSDNDYIIKALSLGAKGYILKQDFDSIVPALKAVMSGQSVFGRDIGAKLPGLLHSGKAFSYRDCGITEKEEEIIVLVAQGLNNKEISEKAFLSIGTVRNYLSIILDKLDLRDRTQLAVFHYKNH